MVQKQVSPDFLEPVHEWRRLFAETWGTFLLVLVAAGGGVVAAQSGGAVTLGMIGVASGLMVMAIINSPKIMIDPLNDKEENILQLIADGKSNKKIANAVFLAEGTVKNYVSRIMEKLHANTRTELAVMSVRQRRGD